ncbi:TPA: hypothetical protein ACGOXR_001948 [Streptococcus suis]
MAEGNFGFIENINADVYSKLHSAEKKARTDFRSSGHDTREALEKIVGSIIVHYRLNRAIPKNLELSKKIEYLQDEDILRQAGYLNQGEKVEDKPILPDLGMVSFKYNNGGNATEDYYAFMRKYGNTCSHADSRPSDVKISYENTIKCLKGYHLFLRKYYKGRISDTTPAFDENIMTIEEYHIYKSYIPNDKNRSKCEREFLAYMLDTDGEKDFYAVLRLYNKADISDFFLQRNHKCFTEASKMSISSVPEGMTKMRELIPIESEQSSFYIISYIFNREPHELSDQLLSEMTMEQRVKLCCRIANCMYNLHTSEVPIEHRMLNYESIFVCKFRDEWIPYVIKFDFAKIESNSVKYTVFDNAVKAKDKINERKLSKYIPPEWEAMESIETVDWAKVDIFSLGILFSDILMGKISENPVSIDDLEELDLSEELLDLFDLMRADDLSARFGIRDIKDIFDDELRS